MFQWLLRRHSGLHSPHRKPSRAQRVWNHTDNHLHNCVFGGSHWQHYGVLRRLAQNIYAHGHQRVFGQSSRGRLIRHHTVFANYPDWKYPGNVVLWINHLSRRKIFAGEIVFVANCSYLSLAAHALKVVFAHSHKIAISDPILITVVIMLSITSTNCFKNEAFQTHTHTHTHNMFINVFYLKMTTLNAMTEDFSMDFQCCVLNAKKKSNKWKVMSTKFESQTLAIWLIHKYKKLIVIII